MDEFKQAQRATWAAGDFDQIAQLIWDVGEGLVDRVGVDGSMQVLDVACGTGNAAIPAAKAGARVTGLDLVPELLADGKRNAEAAGVEVEWVEGDAEELPFEDSSFDRVLSTFGHMFAPRHQRTADELARVVRPDGVIGFCCWTPEGAVGRMFKESAQFAPPPPDYAQPPVLWGTEDHVREMFSAHSPGIEFERRMAVIEWDGDSASFADYFKDRFGPMVIAQQGLGERFSELRERIIALYDEINEAPEGKLKMSQEYLLSVVSF